MSRGSLTLQSRLYGRILRQAPAALEASVGRLVRGGYLRLVGGAPAWLPLGARVMERILREARRAWGEAQAGYGAVAEFTAEVMSTDLT